MMRITNIPLSIGQVTLAISTALLGFSVALWLALDAWAVARLILFAWWVKLPVFDRSAPASVAWQYFGWIATLGWVYLFFRWWLFEPRELWILQDTVCFGPGVAVFFLFVGQIFLDAITQILFLKLFRSA